ncbi:MAG: TetR/AcrR family transcriptional regulator [Desulfovibrio sp.]|jgi:AcrR family transcriptional regulator|nr:TetR/AcrR family transcriptional regulator [Desulfovibrio sp.]
MDAQSATPLSTFDKLDPQKRGRVLEESLAEFAEHGYHQASVNRIVGRLGIAKGSLFQYFGSKEGLFRHLFSRALEEIKTPLKAIRDADTGEAFPLRLRRVFVEGAAFARSHPLIWRVYRRMVTQDGFPLREQLLSQVRGEALTYFRELVEGGQTRGEIRPEVDPLAAAFLIEAALDRALTAQDSPLLDAGFGLSSNDESTRRARLAALADMLSRGLMPPTGDTNAPRAHD